MDLTDFSAFGDFAAAGLRATQLALAEAVASSEAGRIPIAGAAVQLEANGHLTTVTVGCNGRIPADDSAGYPTDHGETSAIRRIEDLGAWDWDRVVFATTLSPCIMCTRTLMALHAHGLRRIAVAESQSFSGRTDLLRPLDGMTLVELACPDAVERMARFARQYPWDWAADIGEIPPARSPAAVDASVFATLAAHGHDVAVVGPEGILAAASDRRALHGGNPVHSAAMIAMGRAGSAVNLREQSLAVRSDRPIDLTTFGHASLGACELFRPGQVVCNQPVAPEITRPLHAVGTRVQFLRS